MAQAAQIAVTEIMAYLQGESVLERVMLVCFNDRAYQAYSRSLQEAISTAAESA